ncbi:MAG TPA: recombinase family protein, partial [Kofleriaceae bacterium]|nr:recombinase family protein [Kofleriaceae bacterium]
MRVALYARVSTERQQERGTISSQLEALRAAAQADGHEVIEEFVDDGYSGARLDRPALDRLRDAAEAGVFDAVLCLCVDRLARAYAYQVLILEELESFGVSVRFLEGPAHGDDPQAKLLIQMQGVIAEYEKAKIAERYRRGKLYRARAGEIVFWKVSYGHRRVVPADGGPARIEIFEPEAEVVREIFYLYVERGLSVRQIAFRLRERGIPSPTGKPIWGTSTIDRLLRNEAYIGTMYYNRHESIPGNGPRGARNRNTRQRERPREEWIAIPVPPIIDRDTFERVKQITRDNSQWNPRGAEPGAWLLRGLVQCGNCHVTCHCQRMRGRNGAFHRYYHCPNHDVLRAGSDDRRCPERNIRANDLDQYVFEQVRQALLDPQQLIAAERAVIAGAPDENQLVATQLKRLDATIAAKERERTRLLDAYQAGLLELDELTRRTATLTARRGQLLEEKDALTKRSAELATENRLRRRLAGFAERVAASLDDLDFEGRQRLLRLVVEKVRVTGWRVEIHLKIPLADEPPPDANGPSDGPPDDDPRRPGPEPPEPLSSDLRLRSLRVHRHRELALPPRPGPQKGPQSMTPRPAGALQRSRALDRARGRVRALPQRPAPLQRHPRAYARRNDHGRHAHAGRARRAPGRLAYARQGRVHPLHPLRPQAPDPQPRDRDARRQRLPVRDRHPRPRDRRRRAQPAHLQRARRTAHHRAATDPRPLTRARAR